MKTRVTKKPLRFSYIARFVFSFTFASCFAFTLLGNAAPAQAESYRYWTVWIDDKKNGWEFVSVQTNARKVKNAQTIGLRFTVAESLDSSNPPRMHSKFKKLCGAFEINKKEKNKVAVVIDYGYNAEAPTDETPPEQDPVVKCLRIDKKSTIDDVLKAINIPILYSGNFICSLSGYPESECGYSISDEHATAIAKGIEEEQNPNLENTKELEDSQGSFPWLEIAVGLGVFVLILFIIYARNAYRKSLREQEL